MLGRQPSEARAAVSEARQTLSAAEGATATASLRRPAVPFDTGTGSGGIVESGVVVS